MGTFAFVILGLLLVVIVYFGMTYNTLVQVKHNVAKSWSNIDVLLRQRHDELPKLVETCKQYGRFEQETLQKVMEARARVSSARESQDVPALGAAEDALRGSLGRLFAVAEAYPDLKTNQTYAELQRRISALEDGIADRREFYNESVNVNNVRIEQFPGNIVAGMFGFRPAALLRFEAGDTADVDVKALFDK